MTLKYIKKRKKNIIIDIFLIKRLIKIIKLLFYVKMPEIKMSMFTQFWIPLYKTQSI